eukprot:Opistho-1_new@75564
MRLLARKLDFHERLHQLHVRFAQRLFSCCARTAHNHGRREFVSRQRGDSLETHHEVLRRIPKAAATTTGLHGALARRIDGRDRRNRRIQCRNVQTGQRGFELRASCSRSRRHLHLHNGLVLFAPMRSVACAIARVLDGAAGCFAIRHAHEANGDGNFELAHKAIADNVEVQLAHSAHNELSSLVVHLCVEARVFSLNCFERLEKRRLVRCGLRLNRAEEDGFRDLQALQSQSPHPRAASADEGITRLRLLQADKNADVTRGYRVNVTHFVGERKHDARRLLLDISRRVVQRCARVEPSRKHARVDERTLHVVVLHFERERHEWTIRRRRHRDALAAGIQCHLREGLRGRRKVVHHGVEQRLHALVLVRCAEEHRNALVRERGTAKARNNLIARDAIRGRAVGHSGSGIPRVCFNQQRHGTVVDLCHALQHRPARSHRLVKQRRVCRACERLPHNLARQRPPAARCVREFDRLKRHKVDHARKARTAANRQLREDGIRTEALLHRAECEVCAGAFAVELVDERYFWDAVLRGLAPHRDALRLHAVHGIVYGHRTVKHPH